MVKPRLNHNKSLYAPVKAAAFVAPNHKHKISFILLAVAATYFVATQTASAQAINTISSRCQNLYSSDKTISDMGRSQADLRKIRDCLDYGIDPPLRARDNNGRGTANASRIAARIPGRSCGPFTTCIYGASVTNAAVGILNPVDDSRSFQNAMEPVTPWTAPQFTGQLPASQMPDHLANGGTIYFYGDQCISSPSGTLIAPEDSLNNYSSGGTNCLNGAHIMTPALPPDGDVMGQTPVIIQQDGMVNWDDWGVVVFPAGFGPVTVGGVTYTGGQPYFVQHTADMYLPAGTALYTLPGNSNTSPDAEHSPPIEYPPYTGPAPVLPTPRTDVTNPGNPPDSQWW